MKSKALTIFAGAVAAVVVVSVAVGLAAPDGSVGDKPTASSTPTTSSTPTEKPTPSTTPTETAVAPSAALAPESVRGVWPGHPAKAKVTGNKINWCPAVRITGEAQAVALFGKKAVDAAACAAVRFMFDKRYSRLAIPRQSYKSSQFDFVLSALTTETANNYYRPRISAFVADPGSTPARDALGLVLLRGNGTSGDNNSAGVGRVYYGKAFSLDGYKNRAVWVNPKWSKVAISIDYSKSEPRIAAKLTAKASVPVFNKVEKRDNMLTVATSATYLLRHGGGTPTSTKNWAIGAWTVTTNTLGFSPLKVN
ncbi:MAG: hypothetical protein ABIN55_13780 [Aeromicrobium sp.]